MLACKQTHQEADKVREPRLRSLYVHLSSMVTLEGAHKYALSP
jgi:hypothetical protein